MAENTPPPAGPRSRRARGPAELENSIAPASAVRESAAPPAAARSAGAESASVASADPPAPSQAPRGFVAVPEDTLDRYYRIRNEFFLDNGELAFVNQGERLATRSENAQIVRDLVRIAHHNGYTAIAVSGTDRFRREAWAQATRLGLDVHGYTPTEHDKKQWVRSLARENARQIAQDAPALGAPSTPSTPPPSAPVSASPPTESAPSLPAPGGAQDGRAYFGELLEHGTDHYQHNPREDLSYFVKLATARGEVELWGLDLKRAFTESKSNPQIGEPIGVLKLGQQPVTVKSRLFDEAGQFLGEGEKATHRNRWQIEKREFFDERAQLAAVLRDPRIAAQEGTQRHPQLVGTYFVLKEAEEFAKHAYRTAAERESFLTLMRERLAEEIERGAALRTTQIRDRARSVAPEAPDRRSADPSPQTRRRLGPRSPQDLRGPQDPEPVR